MDAQVLKRRHEIIRFIDLEFRKLHIHVRGGEIRGNL